MNGRLRNRSGGTSGSRRRRMSPGNRATAVAPTAIARKAIGSCQRCCSPRVAPKASPPTPTAITVAPSQSKRPVAPSSRDSGTKRSAKTPRATIGTLTRNTARQDTAWTSNPPTSGPAIVMAEVAAAQIPIARPRSSPSQCRADDRQGLWHQQGTGRTLEEPGDHQGLQGGRQAAEDRGHAEADEPDGEHAPASEPVAERAGQNEERGEDDQVPGRDVGQPFKAAEHHGRQLLPDGEEGDVDDRAIEEYDARSQHDREQDPAAPHRHRRHPRARESMGRHLRGAGDPPAPRKARTTRAGRVDRSPGALPSSAAASGMVR